MFKYFRILIPAWRFFDDTTVVPKLYVRSTTGGQLESGWLPGLKVPKLKWYSLFLNPEGNLYHAVCNALEHLLRHPEDRQAQRIVERYVHEKFGADFEFRVSAQ